MSDLLYSLRDKRVFVAGHRGMVGAALMRRLAQEGCRILVAERETLDLARQADVETWMAANRPHAVFLAAGRVGGILANSNNPVDFLYDNLMIEANVIHAAYAVGVEKLMFLGSSCIYPRETSQPIAEDALLTGPLEPTNQWYAIAKIAGIKLAQAYRRQHGADFVSAMPTNLYGPGDTYDSDGSHVVPALILKVHEAREAGAESLDIWGSGRPLREFLHVDDCADALVHLMKSYSGEDPVNVGSGTEVTIDELARLVMAQVGYAGRLTHDVSKPDGAPRKLLDSSRLHALGWVSRIGLAEGLRHAYEHAPFFSPVPTSEAEAAQ
jgi:GDP-L-fucose synthase